MESAADLVLARGVGGTSLDDIRAGTRTSKSQLFHYFPAGKTELVGAIAGFQNQRVLDAQRPHLDDLSTLESWRRWRDAVVAHYAAQPHWGCPIGSLSQETAQHEPELAAELAGRMDHWRELLRQGLDRLRVSDPHTLALTVFAALQGGLLLTKTMQSIEPLEAALDGALDLIAMNLAASAV